MSTNWPHFRTSDSLSQSKRGACTWSAWGTICGRQLLLASLKTCWRHSSPSHFWRLFGATQRFRRLIDEPNKSRKSKLPNTRLLPIHFPTGLYTQASQGCLKSDYIACFHDIQLSQFFILGVTGLTSTQSSYSWPTSFRLAAITWVKFYSLHLPIKIFTAFTAAVRTCCQQWPCCAHRLT